MAASRTVTLDPMHPQKHADRRRFRSGSQGPLAEPAGRSNGKLDGAEQAIHGGGVPTLQPTLGLGYSSCPNDTFMFHALAHGLVRVPGASFAVYMDDIEGLNRRALGESSAPRLPISKVSASLSSFLLDDYVVLRAGAALGRGVGPLVVAKGEHGFSSLADLAGKHVAVPGLRTTAYLLLSLFAPPGLRVTPVRFDRIMPRVADGEFDAGLIIHESRFTYGDHGLSLVSDVGTLWEAETELPLPLGVIVARRDLGTPLLRELERSIADSVRYAFAHPDESKPYIREHAQELSEQVCQQHIELYVNQHSIELGAQGVTAVETLFERGAAVGILPALRKSIWID
jgi:1,4-dihydroxy-6-naphthoate synthase